MWIEDGDKQRTEDKDTVKESTQDDIPIFYINCRLIRIFQHKQLSSSLIIFIPMNLKKKLKDWY